MEPSAKFVVAPQVVAREEDDKIVLLDTASTSTFSLNEIGARIWVLVEEGKSFGEICDHLVAEYDVPRDEAASDAEGYLRELQDRSLIAVEP